MVRDNWREQCIESDENFVQTELFSAVDFNPTGKSHRRLSHDGQSPPAGLKTELYVMVSWPIEYFCEKTEFLVDVLWDRDELSCREHNGRDLLGVPHLHEKSPRSVKVREIECRESFPSGFCHFGVSIVLHTCAYMCLGLGLICSI